MDEILTTEDVLKQLKTFGREPMILEKGKQELLNISTYKNEIQTMIYLLDDAKKCVENGLNDASILILENVSEWLSKLYDRSNGDFNNHLKL